jgi:hypothetical protein
MVARITHLEIHLRASRCSENAGGVKVEGVIDVDIERTAFASEAGCFGVDEAQCDEIVTTCLQRGWRMVPQVALTCRPSFEASRRAFCDKVSLRGARIANCGLHGDEGSGKEAAPCSLTVRRSSCKRVYIYIWAAQAPHSLVFYGLHFKSGRKQEVCLELIPSKGHSDP